MPADWERIRSRKPLCDRDPVKGADLASNPTLSRFESAFDQAGLYHVGVALSDAVIEDHRRRLKRKAKRITIDLDPTDDPTHGAQQLTFFNGLYDTWCYLSVAGFLTFNEEAEQHLIADVLRPGNVIASVGAIGILSRLLSRLRAARTAFRSTQVVTLRENLVAPNPIWPACSTPSSHGQNHTCAHRQPRESDPKPLTHRKSMPRIDIAPRHQDAGSIITKIPSS